jgi:hypothetical protein
VVWDFFGREELTSGYLTNYKKIPKKIITLLKDVSLGRFSCATSA